jgi:osmotically-inducible protein OsmY
LILIVLAFSGCVALTGETAGENVDDTVLTTEIKAKLAAEKVLHTTRVGVKTERGVVYLTGSVETAEERGQINKIVRGVRGVREVVDRLEVRP